MPGAISAPCILRRAEHLMLHGGACRRPERVRYFGPEVLLRKVNAAVVEGQRRCPSIGGSLSGRDRHSFETPVSTVDRRTGGPADVAVNPTQPNVVYVGTGSSGFSGQGVFKSVDRGSTFTAANRGMLDVAIAAVAAAADGTVYAAGSSKFYRSQDGGANWLFTTIAPGSGNGSVARIVVNEDLGGVLFLLFSNLEVQVSCDRGSSFQPLVSKPSLGWSSGFVAPPLLVSLAGTDLTLIAGNSGSGAFRTNTSATPPTSATIDGGVADAGAIDGGAALASPCPFWKSFRAKSWQAISDLPAAVDSFATDPESNNVFAGTSGAGVFKSVDQGASWISSASGLPSFTGFGGLTAMALCGSAPTAVCVDIGNAVYATVDGGTSWSKRASNMSDSSGGFDILLSLPTNRSVLFGFAYTVFKNSTNGGAGWSNVGTGFPNQPSVMAASPNDQNLIYAGTGFGPYSGQGVYKSVDRGINWSAANTGILDKSITALAVDGADKVWAASGSTLYTSSNGGSSWTDVSAALPYSDYDSIVQLVLGPVGSNAMFALRGSLQTEVTCDGGTTWYTIAPKQGGLTSSLTNPVLQPLGASNPIVLLAGTIWDGGLRLVIE